MNPSLISHRMFVAALGNDTGAPSKPPVVARPNGAANGARRSAPSHVTVEQLAAMAARYWPDFPFAAGREQRAE